MGNVDPDIDLRNCIMGVIESRPGIKGVELAIEVATRCKIEYDVYAELMDRLIYSGDIVEVQYILPSMPYRVKSVFFPKYTKILEAKHAEMSRM